MEWLPLVISVLALAGSAIGWLLLDAASKTRTASAAASASEAAQRAAASAKEAHDKISNLEQARAAALEAQAALVREIDRLSRDKADASVVDNIQAAIVDVKTEMIRQFDRLENRLDLLDSKRTRT